MNPRRRRLKQVLKKQRFESMTLEPMKLGQTKLRNISQKLMKPNLTPI